MQKTIQSHPFHLVEPSPWPLAASLALLTTTLSGVMYFNNYANGGLLLTLGLISTVLSMSLWFRDIIIEGTFQGSHTSKVQQGLTLGFILFVISEVFFFISLFWAFFHSALSPTVELGCMWPPAGIQVMNPWEVPLLNTVLLLSSGATVTLAHHGLIQGNRKFTIYGLIATIILAILFTGFQGFEYINAPFTIADSVYGSTFYFTTGFHGFHVLIGTIFIAVGLYRVINYHFTDFHHVGLEAAIIYWHFVDIVWLLVFIFFYYWGS
ncbi:cytochrome c oxidase subunit 3 (mitochondrion) [Entomortierella parvispora]|uniref:Cytochrome c oxidase subunit 3 n=1 Tax=Entomortierella parvispora TaxID=205924 RepID=A0A8J9S4B3_9FUNG|nr:cytochrome c oxidase subunit 3 [Entomortierella parvispora]